MTAHCRERPADCCRSGPLFRCAGKGRNGCASRAHQITPDARGDESTIRRWARDTRLHVQEGQTGGQGCFATSVLMLPRAGSSSALQHRGPSKHRLRVILPASPTTTAHIHGTYSKHAAPPDTDNSSTTYAGAAAHMLAVEQSSRRIITMAQLGSSDSKPITHTSRTPKHAACLS
jgi:hypothetical protein